MTNADALSRRQIVAGFAAVTAGSAVAASPTTAADAPLPPAVSRTVPDSCAHQSAVTRGYIQGPFGQIHYRSAGQPGAARPLLMLHPSPLSGYVFEVFMTHAGHNRLVIAPDTPGFGMSDPPAKMPAIADYATAMLSLASSLKLETFDVMGYHTGSSTAVEMALRAPAAIKHLVLVGAPLLDDAELAAFKRQYVERQIDDVPGAFSRRWPIFRDRDWRMVCSPARAMNILMDSFRNPDVSHWGHHAALDFPLEQRMRQLTHPTLVLNPQDDLWQYTGRASRFLKNGRVHDFPGWTHGFLDTKAEDVLKVVDAFLET